MAERVGIEMQRLREVSGGDRIREVEPCGQIALRAADQRRNVRCDAAMHPGTQHCTKRRVAEQNAGEAERRADARRHPRAIPGNGPHDGFLRLTVEQPAAAAEHEHRAGQRQRRMGKSLYRHVRHGGIAQPRQGESQHENPVRRQTCGQPPSDLRKQQHGNRERQHGDACTEHRFPSRVLEKLRQQRGHYLRTGSVREHGERCSGERPRAEQRQIEHRLRTRTLHAREDREEHGTGGEARQNSRAGPASGRRCDQCPRHAEHCAREQSDAGNVDTPLALRFRLGNDTNHGECERSADRHIDVERPAPAERVANHAADEWREHHRQAHHHAPQPPRPGTRLFFVETVADDGERRGQQKRCTDALRSTRDVEPLCRGRQTARERCRREAGDAAEKHATAPEAISDRASGQ